MSQPVRRVVVRPKVEVPEEKPQADARLILPTTKASERRKPTFVKVREENEQCETEEAGTWRSRGGGREEERRRRREGGVSLSAKRARRRNTTNDAHSSTRLPRGFNSVLQTPWLCESAHSHRPTNLYLEASDVSLLLPLN